MALFPEVQRKAQAELDLVVGPSRLPDFDDLDNMPYIQAVVKETMRWMPVLPIGLPHAVISDDSYKGYHIPKGSMIIPVSVFRLLRVNNSSSLSRMHGLYIVHIHAELSDRLMLGAHRAMLHSPVDYPDPEHFKPERFIGKDGALDPTVLDPDAIVFGFGRR